MHKTEEAGNYACTSACVSVRPCARVRARVRHEYLMRCSVFMRLKDGEKQRESKR